jgi:hypothetical protein
VYHFGIKHWGDDCDGEMKIGYEDEYGSVENINLEAEYKR